MDKLNAYTKQNTALENLFAVLPQTALTVIALLRVIVAVPLFIGGLEMFSFFESKALAIAMSAIVVLALEAIGLVASLLTAFFRANNLNKAFYIALLIGLFSMFFNAFLLKSIENLTVGFVAQVVFQSFNVLSFCIGEAIGFLVVSVKESEKLIEKTEKQSEKIELVTTTEELTSKMVQELKEEGKTHQEIAELFGTNISKVSRLLKAS